MPDQGLPQRQFPFQPIPCQLQWAWTNPMPDGKRAVALVWDSPDVRAVAFWSEDALLDVARKLQAFIAKGPESELTVADLDDLKALRDVAPFAEPPSS